MRVSAVGRGEDVLFIRAGGKENFLPHVKGRRFISLGVYYQQRYLRAVYIICYLDILQGKAHVQLESNASRPKHKLSGHSRAFRYSLKLKAHHVSHAANGAVHNGGADARVYIIIRHCHTNSCSPERGSP